MIKRAFFITALLSAFSRLAFAETTYRLAANTIQIIENGKSERTCSFQIEIDSAVESFDGDAVIVSNRGFVRKSDLFRCSEGKPVPVSMIPAKVGILTDVNVSKNLYVSLEFVSVQPFTWLATIAHLGSSKSLVTLNGAYLKGKSLATLRKYSFGGSGVAGTSAISPDGKYVAVNGNINCGADSYPGVWDIRNNTRVILDDKSCMNLFVRYSK